MNELHKYWFSFENIDKPTSLNLGCGVTADDRQDAIFLMQTRIFRNRAMPKILHVTDDVKIDSLDHGHVVPNVGNMNIRGIWFPQGYSEN